jgi:DnaJ-class molecular chaperone
MATEWINPQYTETMAELRSRQATAPRVKCTRCKGAGQLAAGPCPPCQGTGAAPAAVRMFVTTR